MARQAVLLTLSAAVLVAGACSSRGPTAPDEVEQAVSDLRDLTQPYQDIDAARAAGWDIQITDCMSDAQGAMGFHFGKGDHIDAVVESMKPEVLMYEPAADGRMKLVGIEYVVPFDAWQSSSPPTLLGRNFERNETFQVWALHMWIWRDNPAGVFASWNADVSCAHAAAANLKGASNAEMGH